MTHLAWCWLVVLGLAGRGWSQCGVEVANFRDCLINRQPTPSDPPPDFEATDIQNQAASCLTQAGCKNPFIRIVPQGGNREKRQSGRRPPWGDMFPRLRMPKGLSRADKQRWKAWARTERQRRRRVWQERQEAKAAQATEEAGTPEPDLGVGLNPRLRSAMAQCKDRVVDREIKPALLACLEGKGTLSGFRFPAAAGDMGHDSKDVAKHHQAQILLKMLVGVASRSMEEGFCPSETAQAGSRRCLEGLGGRLAPAAGGCANPVQQAYKFLGLKRETCNVFQACKSEQISQGCEETLATAYQEICECGESMDSAFLEKVAANMQQCLFRQVSDLPQEQLLSALQEMIKAAQTEFSMRFCVAPTIPDPCGPSVVG